MQANFKAGQTVLNIAQGRVLATAKILEFVDIGGEQFARLVDVRDASRGTMKQLINWRKTWAAPIANLALVP